MKKMEEKTLLTIDALSILSWAEDGNGYIANAKLPIKMMWGLKEDISLLDWLKNNTHYFPKNIDNSSVEEYKKELESVVDDIKENINKLFQMETDEGDSDLYGSEDE